MLGQNRSRSACFDHIHDDQQAAKGADLNSTGQMSGFLSNISSKTPSLRDEHDLREGERLQDRQTLMLDDMRVGQDNRLVEAQASASRNQTYAKTTKNSLASVMAFSFKPTFG